MRSSALLLAATCALVQAATPLRHTINPVVQHSEYGADYSPLIDVSNAIRGPKSGTEGIRDLKSKDLLCGPGGDVEAKEWAHITGEYYGLKFNWESFWNSKTQSLTSFGKSFKGSYAAYIARPEDIHKPDGWVKVSHWSYQKAHWWRDDLEKPVWGSDVMKAFHGDFFVPHTWAYKAGKYILRLELIDYSEGKPVVYPLCVQLNIVIPEYDGIEDDEDFYFEVGLKGRTTDIGLKGVGFPGTYTPQTPGIKFSFKKDDPSTYKHPSGEFQLLQQSFAVDYRVKPVSTYNLDIFTVGETKVARRMQSLRKRRAHLAKF